MNTLPERLQLVPEMYRKMLEGLAWDMRVACPGIIQSFDAAKQTVTVQLALREKINIDGVLSWEQVPLLVDVPIVIPRAGNFVLTMPVQAGDECLVVFGDCCMDAWYQSGGVQNQIDKRRHDLSDGFAVLGIWSQPHTVPDYSTSTAQLRSLDGATKIDVAAGNVTITADHINLNSQQVTIAGRDFLSHTHSCPQCGSTGGVN